LNIFRDFSENRKQLDVSLTERHIAPAADEQVRAELTARGLRETAEVAPDEADG
jgi:hypothetical protein